MRAFIACWGFDVDDIPLCLVDIVRKENDLRAYSVHGDAG
jgi:hypothetical protein